MLTVPTQSDQMEILERERAWKEEEFDFVLQFLRTVLLKRKCSIPNMECHPVLMSMNRRCIAHIYHSLGSKPFTDTDTLIAWNTISS